MTFIRGVINFMGFPRRYCYGSDRYNNFIREVCTGYTVAIVVLEIIRLDRSNSTC